MVGFNLIPLNDLPTPWKQGPIPPTPAPQTSTSFHLHPVSTETQPDTSIPTRTGRLAGVVGKLVGSRNSSSS